MLEIILIASLIISGTLNGLFITKELLKRRLEEQEDYRKLEKYIEEVKK